MFDNIFRRNCPEDMVRRVIWSDNEKLRLRYDMMKIIKASFGCVIHHEIMRWRIGFAVWMLGEFSIFSEEADDGLSVIKRSIGELPLSLQPDADHIWFEECRRRLLSKEDDQIQRQISTAVTKLFHKVYSVVGESRILAPIVAVKRTETVMLLASIRLLPKHLEFGVTCLSTEIWKQIISICDQDEELSRLRIFSSSSDQW